ncbi:MAG: carbohydrate porin [Opitutaceae bacterium]|nr:carbohydrate porin [Opitutaceae bacterium]
MPKNSKLLLSSLLLASSTALVASDAGSDARFADRLTGDWGGARSRLADKGLTFFATFAYTPQDDIAIIPLQSTLGAHYKGLLPGRPDDRTVAFVTYGKFSDEFFTEQVGLGGSPVDYEMVFEVGHRVQLTKYAYVQPDIQFIKRPGGTGNIDDAVVLGVQFGASF